MWNYLNRFYPMPSSNVTNEELSAFADVIIKKKLKYLRGYPSSIANFAQFCSNNKKNIQLKSVITTAEVLRDEYKAEIKKAFNCVIIDTYGCADGGGNANTCEHDKGFHLSTESSIWEVCDTKGNPTPDKSLGEVTLTSLTNYAMPLIRYQPGDLIENSIDFEKCSCGKTLPRIKRIYGRSTDILKFGNGRTLGGPAFTLLFREFPLIKYQIVQNELLSVDVNFIPNLDFNLHHEKRIYEIMKHHCGKEVEVYMNKLNNLELPVSGKHRFIISNV